MTRSFPICGVPLLFVLLVGATACDRSSESMTAPSATLEMSAVESSLGVEPRIVPPTFLPADSCVGGSRPFGARVSVVFRGDHDLILRGLRLSFTDRFGQTALPQAVPIPTQLATLPEGSSIPTTTPVTLPGIAALPDVSPIAMPGSRPITGLVFAGGSSHMLHYFVRFGCGVFPDGVLIILADAGDRTGRFSTSELRVRITP